MSSNHVNSIEAYKTGLESGSINKKEFQVIELLQQYPNKTASELAKLSGLPVRSIAPRLTELMKLGIVYEAFYTKCSVTHSTACSYALTGNNPKPRVKKISKVRQIKELCLKNKENEISKTILEIINN